MERQGQRPVPLPTIRVAVGLPRFHPGKLWTKGWDACTFLGEGKHLCVWRVAILGTNGITRWFEDLRREK